MPALVRKKHIDARQITGPLPDRAGFDDEMSGYDFLMTFERSDWDSPEQRLCAAILQDAVSIFLGGAAILGGATRAEINRRKQHAAMRDRKWIESPECDYAFSFINICQTLKIEPEWLRPRVLGLEKSGKPGYAR